MASEQWQDWQKLHEENQRTIASLQTALAAATQLDHCYHTNCQHPTSPEDHPIHGDSSHKAEAHGWCTASQALAAANARADELERKLNIEILRRDTERPVHEQQYREANARAEAAEREQDKFKTAEHNLSEAYLRLRKILSAWDTNSAPTSEKVWAYVESVAQKLVRDNLLLAAEVSLLIVELQEAKHPRTE